jgi:AcrR family transcriptional regulator
MLTRPRSSSTVEPVASGTEAGDGRGLILDTAARLFREEGYAATSLRDIASACGMQAGSLYYHFASKDAIIAEVLRIGVERVSDHVRRSVLALPPDADARTLLHTAVRAHLSALLELHDYTSANVRIFGQVPAAVREAHIATRDAYERFWTTLLRRCARVGGWDPRRKLGLTRLFLINALNGSLEWFTDGRSSVEQLAHELTELFLDGLNARPPVKARRMLRAT